MSQIYHQSIQSMNFSDFSELILCANEKIDTILFLDKELKTIWDQKKRKTYKQSELEVVKQHIQEKPLNIPFTITKTQKLFCIKVPEDELDHDSHIATIVVVTPKDTKVTQIKKLLKGVAKVFLQMYLQNKELNTMAYELRDRYEELNMVYDTNREFESQTDLDGSFDAISANIVDYLNVACSIVFLPTQRIFSTAYSEGESELVNESFAQSALELVSKSMHIIVVNKPSDRHANIIQSNKFFKFICCPIFNENDKVNGCIIVINDSDKDFTNSDKNLVDVLGKKTSKILLSKFDTLTGLPKRRILMDKLDQIISVSNKNLVHSLMVIDIDDLHYINETYGTNEGDRIIVSVAQFLKTKIKSSDILAYEGSGRYIILCKNCHATHAEGLSNDIVDNVQTIKTKSDQSQLSVSVSIGVTTTTPKSSTSHDLLMATEIACDHAKEQGKGRTYIYDPSLNIIDERKSAVNCLSLIQSALKNDDFLIYGQIIQPTEFISSSLKPHIEVLIRMHDHNNKIMPPYYFIPVAEQFHLMPQIDKWVIKNTFKLISTVGDKIFDHLDHISINLSGQSLSERDLVKYVIDMLTYYKIPSHFICFEITESSAIENLEQAQSFIKQLKQFGCYFSLDDFGSGMSSFGYLKSLPIDFLKIDGMIVKDMVTDKISDAMVFAIHELAEKMELKTIAEFVKNEQILTKLKDIHVDYVQGFYIDKPKPLMKLVEQIINPDDEYLTIEFKHTHSAPYIVNCNKKDHDK